MSKRNNLENDIVSKTAEHVRKVLEYDGSGHDWWHIERVWKLSKRIAKDEKADMLIVELGALLHDIADWKFNNGDLKAGAKISTDWLREVGLDSERIARVAHIVENVSYKGAMVKNKMKSIEGKIVQDADRLDAIGAIGIARVFAYGGHKNRPLHDPTKKFIVHRSFAEYKKGSLSSIHHFYDKLLLVKDMMNTKASRRMAVKRHAYLTSYLKEFMAEWEGKQ